MELYQNRIARARAEMRADGVDFLLLPPSSNLFYTTGIRAKLMERLTCLLLTQEDAHFIVPAFEAGAIGEDKRSLMEIHGWADGEDPFVLVKKLLPSSPSRAVIDKSAPSWILLEMQKLCPALRWESSEEMFTRLRVVKDEYERKMLRQVHEKTAKALVKVMSSGLAGLREIDVVHLLRDACAEEGVKCDWGSVASGPNTASPHHSSGERVIQKGDPVWIDFGGEEPGIGYQSDITRTFCVGSVPEGFQEIYDVVRKANQAAFEAARPGIPCEDVDRAARTVIEEAGYGEYFTHRVGHGLGLEVHEHPYMAPGNRKLVEAGHVCSDEPGIYLPGKYGVRIEDILFIRPDGAERLTPTEPPMDHGLKVVE